jgi:hypothetical protein
LASSSFAPSAPIFIGWSRPQLIHLQNNIFGGLNGNDRMDQDERVAVVATISSSGRVNIRISIYNMDNLYNQQVLEQAYVTPVSAAKRGLANSNATAISFAKVVLAPRFQDLDYAAFRAEVARLSLLPPASRFQRWIPTPINWANGAL